ncbi:uncharacterized protein BDW47DRAFT_121811 [Aspergillus candidus]|uniref:Uncharacterized protein n=1 Tax=Aspergillus candidus TaxID=41067 RepID=A0A2I2FQ12_ASPCN|nr:hypothetical protein BDW47DRAFT_121811 [Aspergillus candidus]PLB42710.1 hypothetical protein BDW47DRAFT_121811 [Aspergillus candidus]
MTLSAENTTPAYITEEHTSNFTPINTKQITSPTMESKKEIHKANTPKASTPQKRTHTPKTQTGQDEAQTNETTPNTPTKKPKTIPTKAILTKANNISPIKKALGPIPTSLEAASTTDKAILRMRDDEGLGWKEITAEWCKLTGVTTPVGMSTLRMRYQTMKANFVGFTADDELRLCKHKRQIEQRFETEKWSRIADAIVADGGAKYAPASLQKKFKQLEKGAPVSTPARVDADDATDNE